MKMWQNSADKCLLHSDLFFHVLFPIVFCYSKRTLERFCADNGIQQRKTIDDEQLYRLVKQAVTQVCHIYHMQAI